MTTDVGPGTRVGDYILDAPIGRGGFATIWRGHHFETEEPAAVKVMSSGPSNSERALQRAEIELLAGAAVRRSSHAVQVLDGGIRPFPYLVMEYVEGIDFAAALRQEGTFTIERTIEARPCFLST